jgi:hypothetical protein
VRIPEIAERLRNLASQHQLPELDKLAGEMGRRRPKNRAAPHSRKMTPELRGEIRSYAQNHPELSQLQIGLHFNVNPGRVSEAVRGFRT